MKTVLIAALAALLAMPLLAQGQMKNNDKAVQEIIDFRNRYIEAEENKDVAYLDKIFSDDFFALNPQGQLLDKPHMLENMKRTYRVFKVLNPRETQAFYWFDADLRRAWLSLQYLHHLCNVRVQRHRARIGAAV